MRLSNSFNIDRPVAEVFDAFLDVERVATCMPGSRLLGSPAADVYQGDVKIKVGPLSVKYAGELQLLNADKEARELTLIGSGREERGSGSVEAHIVARLSERGSGTQVDIDTDLNIRGKVAQFGRGVIGDVTDNIMRAFAANVEELLANEGQPNEAPQPSLDPTPRLDNSRPRGMSEQSKPDDDELDAWSLIIRPLAQRHAGSILSLVACGMAAYVGARLGTRHNRHRINVRP